MCLLKHYAAGDSILEEGSTGLGMFVLLSGRVEVLKQQDGKQQDGRTISLAVLAAGDVLGEMALLDDQPRSASAVALEATECLLLSRERFRILVKRRPPVAWPIVPALALRIRDLQQRLLRAEGTATSEPPAVAGTVDGGASDRGASDRGASDRAASTATAKTSRLADAEGPSATAPTEAVAGSNGKRNRIEPGVNLLRTPYALMMTGTDSLDESARLLEVFLRSFDRSAGISRGRPLGDVARDVPTSLVRAGLRSWSEGLKVPSRMLGRFRRRLRPQTEDPS